MQMNRTTLIGLIMVTLATSVMAYEPLHALPETPPIPSDNPLTAEKVALGRQLYFDVRLSFNNKISCNTCHNLKTGGVDHHPLSTGALGKPGRRSTPTVLNAAYQSVQFWDGRAESLEAAVKDHLFDPTVMAMPGEQQVVEAVRRMPRYRKQFIKAFGTRDAVTLDNIAKAVAGFVRTLVTPDSAFDRYVKGDKQALSEQAVRGMEEFKSAGCVACHFGDNFSGPPVPMGEGFYELFPNYLGSEYDQKYNLVTDDLGRYEATNDPIHKRLFHVPTLRNIALTAPYLHIGTVPSLEEAVRVMAVTQLRKELSDRQVEDIVAFLNSLTGRFPSRAHPKR
ncbi:MAG TPA: cytochrome c peroxidase [Gammaproteobacteria bacterium]|nr:cytochrome c peroxidase [Gammaproteobacteria bacterium]